MVYDDRSNKNKILNKQIGHDMKKGSLLFWGHWSFPLIPYEPRHKKTCHWGFHPGRIQTGLLS